VGGAQELRPTRSWSAGEQIREKRKKKESLKGRKTRHRRTISSAQLHADDRALQGKEGGPNSREETRIHRNPHKEKGEQAARGSEEPLSTEFCHFHIF